ncbi:hypothetical protein D3C76_1608770 [compost metagenome]
MDIAIGQAHSLDDPAMREVLVAIADWKIEKRKLQKIKELPAWSRLSGEAQTLINATSDYYQLGLFPPSSLVSLTPPTLVAKAPDNGAGR